MWRYHSRQSFGHHETWMGVLVVILLTLGGWLAGGFMTDDKVLRKVWRESLGMLGGIVGALVLMQIVVSVVRHRIRASRQSASFSVSRLPKEPGALE